jgi:hypothetical protein
MVQVKTAALGALALRAESNYVTVLYSSLSDLWRGTSVKGSPGIKWSLCDLAVLVSINTEEFFCYYPCDSIWEASRDQLPQSIKQKINTENYLVSIFWLVNGIYSLLDLLQKARYNTELALMLSCPV